MELKMRSDRADKLFKQCVNMKRLAISSKKQVGCVLIGIDNDKKKHYFGGANLETSISFTTHAEVIALHDCLLHKCYPVHLFVTSSSKREKVFLCGACRQQYLEVNQTCLITIFDPDGKIKGTKSIIEVLPYHKNVNEKNCRLYQEFVNAKN